LKPKGRRIAIAAMLMGMATIALTAFVARDRLEEEWWLWKLPKPSSDEDKIRAMDRLGELRSSRAVPLILDLLQGRALGDDHLQSTPVTDSGMLALHHIGTKGKSQFLRGIDDPRHWAHLLSIMQLMKFGSEAKGAIPRLIAMAKCEKVADQRISIEAIGVIAPQDEAIPILIDFLDGSIAQQVAAAKALGEIGPAAIVGLPKLKILNAPTSKEVSVLLFDEVNRAILKIEGQ
jgi:HEAT repeat protein